MEVKDNENGLVASVDCKKCGNRFLVNKDIMYFGVPHKDEKGQTIFLTYFDCPSCNERHYVQVDNTYSLDMKRDAQKLFVKLSVLRNQNKSIPKKQSDKFNKLREKLKAKRFELMSAYDGKEVRDIETGKLIPLSFTIV